MMYYTKLIFYVFKFFLLLLPLFIYVKMYYFFCIFRIVWALQNKKKTA